MWVYCAVTGSFNTVSVPWVTVVESLVQVIVVARPPVEIQVRVSWSGSNVTPPDIEMPPAAIVCKSANYITTTLMIERSGSHY